MRHKLDRPSWDRWTSTFSHRLTTAPLVRDRLEWIIEQTTGRRVLHVGCVDTGLLQDHFERGKLLHDRPQKVCSGLVGLDINEPGIEKLRAMGYDNLIVGDIGEAHGQVIEDVRRLMGRCDFILCGEVLEHVLNMGDFLAGVRSVALTFDAQVIITVPNTYSLESFIPVVFKKEIVHPDHKCYFSQVTLNTLLDQTGFRTTGNYFYSNDNWAKSRARHLAKRLVNRTILAVCPQLAEGVIALAEPAQLSESGPEHHAERIGAARSRVDHWPFYMRHMQDSEDSVRLAGFDSRTGDRA